MKLIKHDSISKHRALNEQYEYILHEYEHKYHFVSVFDGWLNRDDYSKLLVNVSEKEQQNRNAQMHDFSMSLASEYEILDFNCDYSKNEMFFKRFESIDELDVHMNIQPQYNEFEFSVLLPELSAWYIAGEESTHLFVLKDLASVDKLSEIAKKNGLHLFTDI
mgnify:CR=1 FL=1